MLIMCQAQGEVIWLISFGNLVTREVGPPAVKRWGFSEIKWCQASSKWWNLDSTAVNPTFTASRHT